MSVLGALTGWSFGAADGKYYTLGCHAAYVREFAKQVDSMRLFVPVQSRTSLHDTEVCAPNVEIIPLPGYTGYAGAVKHFSTFRRLLLEHGSDVDAWYCRVPDPFAWLPWFMYRKQARGILMHMVGDPIEALSQAEHYSPAKRLLYRLCFTPEWEMTKRAMRHCPSVVNGHTVYERVKHLNPDNSRAVVSSTLTDDDFFPRDDTCKGSEIQLLYVGFLRGAKGVETLLSAFSALRSEGLPVVLKMAGAADPPEYLDRLTSVAKRLGVEKYVSFLGHVAPGPALRDCYRSADIFVFPSLSEGSPRVVLEAMANGLPVVSTRVGSVPNTFIDGQHALLCEPGDAQGLTDCVRAMCTDPELRKRCLIGGQGIARKHTLSAFISELVSCAFSNSAKHG